MLISVSYTSTLLFPKKYNTYTLMVLEPSTLTRVRLPTISEGWQRSSKRASWTAVKVRERGRGCLGLSRREGLARIRR